MAVMSFLASCRDCVGHSIGWDLRIANLSIIMPLPRQLFELINQFNFFQVVSASDLDARLSYLAYRRAQEVDWSFHTIVSLLYYIYRWESAESFVFGACYFPTRKGTASDNVPYGSEYLESVDVCYLPGPSCTREDPMRLETSFLEGVDHPSKSSERPAPPEVPDDLNRLELHDTQDRNLAELIEALTRINNIKAVMQEPNAKRVECEEEPISSVSDVIALDIQYLEQKESLRVAKVERSNVTETNRRVTT